MRECIDEGILQSYFDGELSSEKTESVASHLARCISCARAVRELESESLLLSRALEPEQGPVQAPKVVAPTPRPSAVRRVADALHNARLLAAVGA